jgi:O-antigen/teichoic acid export membrane protein
MHLLANFILVKRYGLMGGVWAAVLVLGLQAFLLYWVSNKLFHIDYEFRRVFCYLFLAGVIYGVSALVTTGGVFLDLGIRVLMLAAFPVLAVAFRIVSQNETARLFEALKAKLRGRLPSGAPTRTN